MTDTDKLKRLAEDKRFGGDYIPVEKATILALIAENERLGAEVEAQRKHASYANQLMDQRVTTLLARCEQLDEAVALLRGLDKVRMYEEEWAPVAAFLARIDGGV